MTLEELRNKTDYFSNSNNPIGVELYILLNEDQSKVYSVDISKEIAEDLKSDAIKYMIEKFSETHNPRLRFEPITEAQEDTKNIAYQYDVDEWPPELEILKKVSALGSFEPFVATKENLSRIKALILRLGNEKASICIYKRHYPINLIKKSSSLLGFISGSNRFEKMNNDLIKIGHSFEFMLLENNLIILSLKVLEKHFGYDEIIKKKAKNNIQLIRKANLLEDITSLEEMLSDLRTAKKLFRLKETSHVLNISFNTIHGFIQKHPTLSKSMKFNAANTRFILETKKSKDLFLKLLNDDFLKSELTELHYESEDKSTIYTDENTKGG